MKKIFNPKAYGAIGDGKKCDTKAIQAAIDDAEIAAQQGYQVEVDLSEGSYLTASLFLKSNIEFHLQKDAILIATTNEDEYPLLTTRVAGIEMEWYVGILNVFDCEHVKITGSGTINGQGPYWWNKYWGKDRRGGMRKIYDAKGLRWCVDYDCRRIRNIVVMNSHQIELCDFQSIQSGFWNVHICYSENVIVKRLTILDNYGPSTDGIDVDSCSHVRISNCSISCNDDNICIKSGRDWDGLRVNKVCQDVTIEDCIILEGDGVTLGSETSGGIKEIVIKNLEFKNTHYGFRIKSAKTRGGLIQKISVENLKMTNVRVPFSFNLNWNPTYSYCEIPSDYQGEIPTHWKILAKSVPENQGIPEIKNVTISNVTTQTELGYDDCSTAFMINAYAKKPISGLLFKNVHIQANEFGSINNVRDLRLIDSRVSVLSTSKAK